LPNLQRARPGESRISGHFSTQWTLVEAARLGDEAAFRALVGRYRAPVVRYLAGRGLKGEAEDLAQEVFLELHQRVLARVQPERGRFRNLLLAVARNVALNHQRKENRLKRGGGEQPRSLGDLEPASPEEERDFEQSWLSHILELALERLEEEHPLYYSALRLFLLEGLPQDEIASRLGKRKGDVKNYVHRGKKKVATYLRAEVRRYSATQEEHDTELNLLARLLPAS
jgi:RNA polymerase sigma-70 factor (ECF subfamily)